MKIFLLITIAAILFWIIYFAIIQPRLRQRRALKEAREWLVNQLGVPIGQSESVDSDILPDGTQVITDVRESWGYPPMQDQVLEEIFSGDEIGDGWDYAVHIHEASEQYLGPEIFSNLQNRFASIPGVDECVQEDREVFLVRTRTLDADNLRKAFWQKFLEAAREVFGAEKRGF